MRRENTIIELVNIKQRKFFYIIVILLLFDLDSFPQTPDSSLYLYDWKGFQYKGSLFVPANFIESNNYYGEGLFTVLTYKDSSNIFLHVGGVIHLPIIDQNEDSNIILTNSFESEKGIIRKGVTRNEKLFWREDKLKNGWVNIGYYGVSKENLKWFEKSISSFKILKR